MLKVLFKNWTFIWTVYTIAAFIFSFIGGYGYFYVLTLFYPISQLFALSRFPQAKFSLLWLLHFPYWLIIIIFEFNTIEIIASLLLSSILGELLLWLILPGIIKFRWMLFNSLAMICLILLGTILFTYRITNDAIQIGLMIFFIGSSALLSAQGIKLRK